MFRSHFHAVQKTVARIYTCVNHEGVLKKFRFFEGLSGESVALLERGMKSVTVRGRQNLIHKGDKVSGVYLVEEGALRVYSISAKGKESTLYWIEPGESCILAMNCVFSDILYPAWVENDRPTTEITIIPGDIYRKLYETEKSIQSFTLDVLSARIFDLMSVLEEVSTLPVGQRLANLLLKKSNSNGHLMMSHEQMAAHIGTAREVVTRNLKTFESMGYIQIDRGYTTILSVDGLRDFLAAG